MRDNDPEDRPRRRPARREKSWLPLILISVVVVLVLIPVGCIGLGFVAYFVFGTQTVTDPIEVKTASAQITEADVPAPLRPQTFLTEATGVRTVEFGSPSGRSFVRLSTGSNFSRARPTPVRKSFERGQQVGGRRPEEPTEKRIIRAEIRGRPAEFEFKRYAAFEAISGYFEGKQYPVHLEAEFDLSECPLGTAEKFVGTIR